MVKWIKIDLKRKILSYEDAKGKAAFDIKQKEKIALLAEIAVLLDIHNLKRLERTKSDHSQLE